MDYDPHRNVDAAAWQSLEEGERFRLVEEYHLGQKLRAANSRLHAAIHVIVESQAAMDDQSPVASTLARLQVEGLDRHEAVHAVGSVLAGQMLEILQKKSSAATVTADYLGKLKLLTAESWKQTRL